MSNGRLNNSGQNGNWWSLTAGYYTSVTDARASNLNFNADGVNPSNSNHRWNGFSLRCLGMSPVRCRSFDMESKYVILKE